MTHPRLKHCFAPSLEIAESITSIGRDEWNDLVASDDPFLEHEFLYALEASGVVGEQTAWHPRYLSLRCEGRLVGAVPFFIKYDSYGEFIFDWQWAEAYSRAGLSYYPKAVVAAPFTPVTGSRLLVHPDADFEATASELVDRLLDFVEAERLSSLHVLFPERREHDLLVAKGLLSRITHQFHWENRGYNSFDDFSADLRSKKRKHIAQERRSVAESGLHIEVLEGEALSGEIMAAMWRFYLNTVSRKWSQAYLNRALFDRLLEGCRHRLLMVMAQRDGRWVGGTLNFRKNNRVLGRYWGAVEDHPGLHFECCFYRLIDYAIANRIGVVEAGAQGEHKFLRGFAARPTFSAHWIAQASGRRAIAAFLDEERRHNLAAIDAYNRVSPLKPLRAAALQSSA